MLGTAHIMKFGWFSELKDYTMICFGCLLYAIGVVFFMMPYQLASGGVSGVGLIVYYATSIAGNPIEVQTTYTVINIILLLVALKVLGIRFLTKTIWGVACVAFWLWMVQVVITAIYGPELYKFAGEGQQFIACVLAALLEGIGIYFCFKSNGSTGGIDIIAACINKYKDISLGTVMMLCDITIISSCYFVFHDWQRCIFGYVMLIISAETLDYLMNRNHQSVQFMVFSRNARNIADRLVATKHGVTVLDGTGWYTHTDRKVVLCVVRRRESVNVMRMIKIMDPYAFVTTANVHGVYGEGFDTMKTKVETKPTLVFATNNQHKLEEVRAMLEGKFEIRSLDDIGCQMEIPENSDTLQGNALEKAQFIKNYFGYDCFADDTGLEVEALDGGPGVYTARFGVMNGYGDSHDADANTACLLDKLKDEENRKCRFRTVIALILDGQTHLFEGIVKGEITPEKRGDKGFGYDPVFIPEGYTQTFAELGVEVKNEISHRARAVKKLTEFLSNK